MLSPCRFDDAVAAVGVVDCSLAIRFAAIDWHLATATTKNAVAAERWQRVNADAAVVEETTTTSVWNV